MHRRSILRLLKNYQPTHERDAQALRETITFVEGQTRCFDRAFAPGHLTGSAWLLDAAGRRCLLVHHRKLGLWLQPGGHADGETDLLQTALREVAEETGLERVLTLSDGIFDLDVHRIPAFGDQPSHLHYDVRFLLQARDDGPLRVSGESYDLCWIDFDRPLNLPTDDSVRRMFEKGRHRRLV